jgi:hypothetical protein
MLFLFLLSLCPLFISEILLEMSEQMPEMKRVVSGFVVTKIIDNFQQIVPQEVFMEFCLLITAGVNNVTN